MLIVLLLSLCLALLFWFFCKDSFSRRLSKNVPQINRWMRLSKDERRLIDYEDKKISMIKRKELLDQIRKEYKIIKDRKK